MLRYYLETPMLRYYWKLQDTIGTITSVTSVTSPPPFKQQVPTSYSIYLIKKQKLKILLQEVHVIFTWCGVDLDMLDSNIFGTWFCWVLTMKFVDHFGSISKISSRFPSSLAYFIALPMYKIF